MTSTREFKENKIKNLQHARDAWSRFCERMQLQEPSLKPLQDKKKTYTVKEIYPTARRIAIEVKNDGSAFSKELLYFLNNHQPITISSDEEKKSQLKLQLNSTGSKLTHPIYKDPELPYLALALYVDGEITFHQLSTLLERRQAAKDFPIQEICSVLDVNNNFTPEAQKYLLPTLNRVKRFRQIAGDTEEEFRLRVMALPKSEQTFTIHKNNYSVADPIIFKSQLYKDGALLSSNPIINLSAGLRDAWSLFRFDEHHIMLRARLGKQFLADYDDVALKGFWPTSVAYPGIIPFGRIHGQEGMSNFLALAHDFHHATTWSKTPKNVRAAFLFLKELIRESLKLPVSKKCNLKISSEIVDFIDADFFPIVKLPHCNLNEITIEKTTNIFDEILDYNVVDEGQRKRSFIMQDGGLTSAGAALCISFVEDRARWLAYKINPDLLTGPIKKYYDEIQNKMTVLKHANKQRMIFHCQLYFALKTKKQENHFPYFARLLDLHKDEIGISFRHLNAKDAKACDSAKNILCTQIFKTKVLNQQQLLQAFIRDRHPTIWKKLQPQRFLFWHKKQNFSSPVLSRNLPVHAVIPAEDTCEHQAKLFKPREKPMSVVVAPEQKVMYQSKFRKLDLDL